jgi:hypothetical protein
MLLDSLLQFCDPQSLTGDAISENVIDLGPLGPVNVAAGAAANTIRDIGAGEPLHLSILVTTTLDSAGEAATMVVTLESDSVVGLDSSATVHWTSASIAEATLVAGYWIAKGILIPPSNYERYLGLRFNMSTEDFTSGAVKAWLHKGRFDERTYESGFSTGVN